MADLNTPLKVISINQIAEGYLKIIFEKPQGFAYEPGNWMDIRFPVPQFPVGHTYSFASSPTEPELIIAFKKGISSFKKALENVKPGNIMLITQYGSNGFLLNKKYQSLFIAGGIGITPFRSMMKEAIDTNNKIPLTLIYMNHTNDFPFRTELDQWQREYPLLQIHYIPTQTYGRLTKEKLKELIPNISDYMNYVAGQPGMVVNTEKTLLELGIRREDIKLDSFEGY